MSPKLSPGPGLLPRYGGRVGGRSSAACGAVTGRPRLAARAPAARSRDFGKVRQVDGSARLTGPVGGQPGIIMAGFDLGQVGYTLEEFFLESAATCFEPAGPAGADGYWPVTP